MTEPSLRPSGLMVGIARALGFNTARSFIEYLREHWNEEQLVDKYGSAEPPNEPTFYGVPRQKNGAERLKWLVTFAAREKRSGIDVATWHRQIDLVVKGLPQSGAVPASRLAGSKSDWIYCYCYLARSRMFPHDAADITSNFTIGYFILDHSDVMKVPHATAWYYADRKLQFDPELRRGHWTSEYVGTSELDILVVYNFEFNLDIDPKRAIYKGLFAAKTKPGLSSVFRPAQSYLGNFYALANSTDRENPSAGEIYIELYDDGPKADFDLQVVEDKLKTDLRSRGKELWGRLGVYAETDGQ